MGACLSLHVEDWPITKVRPYANNPRVLRNAAEKVAESIREFGWRQPIVIDETGEVIAGHSRLAAAQMLKLKKVPVHVARGLTPEQVRALRIADNKTATFAEWDEQKLSDELAAIMEGLGSVAVTGFSQSEFEAIEMRALAELAQITAQEPAAASAPADTRDPAPADPPEPGADELQQDAAAEAPAAVGGEAPPRDLVPFTVLMDVDARQILLDAVSQAKRRHDLQQTADALLVIARSYLDA